MTTTTILSKLAGFAARLRPGSAKHRRSKATPALSREEIYPFFAKAFAAYDDWYMSVPEHERWHLPSFTVANRYLDTAAKESDIEALRIYTKFPELCNPKVALLIPLLREVHGTSEIAGIINKEHIDTYRRIGNCGTGKETGTQFREFAKFVLEDLDRADAVLRIAEQRNLIIVRDIKELLASAAVAPSLGDGAL